jgi:ribosome-binding factor A
MRELQWKGQRPAIESLLMQYNNELGRQVNKSMVEMAGIDELAAERQLKNINITPVLGTAEAAAAVSIPDIKVNDAKLQKWFTAGRGELSLWAKQNFDSINKTVQRGIFEGLETKTIASQIIQESGLAGIKGVKIAGDTVAAKVYRQAANLARTAIAEQNHQINERVWDANKEAMKGVQYEWVATMDSKTCPTCSELAGQVRDSRDDFPDYPIHMGPCRCNVVPYDPDDPNEITGQEISKAPFTYKGKTLDEIGEGKRYRDMSPAQKAKWDEALSKGGLYSTKVKVNGEMYYRKTKTIKIKKGQNPHAQFIAKASKETQDEFFGSRARAELFRREVERGADPQETMVRMLRGPRDDKKWRRVSEGLAAKPKR